MKGKQAAAIIAALLLCGCMGQEPQPMEEETLKPPENAQTASGVVLDITEESLILRTSAGMEYVLDLDGDEIPEGTQVLNGSFVKIYYDGDLQIEPNNVDILYIEADQSEEMELGYKNSTVDGRVISVTEDTLKLETQTGSMYTFSIAQAKQNMIGKLEKGSLARLTFDGRPFETEKALVKQITDLELTGVVRTTPVTVQQYDEEDQTLTVQTWDGTKRKFSTENVECGAEDWEDFEWEEAVVFSDTDVEDAGWLYGKVLKVLFPDDAQQRFYGVVESFDEDEGLLTVHPLTGETLELFVDEALIPSDGLDKNDTICVAYDGWLNGEDVRKLEIEEIEVETKGSNSENSVAGTIWELEEDFFTLRTMDGRTLRFTEKAGEDSVPENVVVGTAVRVYFTGWLTGEDQEENAVVTHVAQLLQ